MESPTTVKSDWAKSMWAKVTEEATFVQCQQPAPPTSNANPEAEKTVPASPASGRDTPSRVKAGSAAMKWMRKSIKRTPPKPQAPKLFDMWTGEDLDV